MIAKGVNNIVIFKYEIGTGIGAHLVFAFDCQDADSCLIA